MAKGKVCALKKKRYPGKTAKKASGLRGPPLGYSGCFMMAEFRFDLRQEPTTPSAQAYSSQFFGFSYNIFRVKQSTINRELYIKRFKDG